MKRILFCLCILCFIGCSNDGLEEEINASIEGPNFQGEVAWIKTFGGSGMETAQSIINTNDGGYAILGFTNSIDGDIQDKSLAVNDYWLLKLDSDGNLEWNKTYGGSKDDKGQSVVQTSDGGYAIVGYAMSSDGDGSNNEGFHDNWILKLTASGEIEWERSFGFSGHDHSYDLVETADGGFFFVGFLDVIASGGEGSTAKGNSLTRHGVGEFWGTKIDANGNIVWRRYFGGTNNDRAHSVVATNDGSFIMSGFSESTDSDILLTKGSYDFWVVKVDGNGEFLWERSFGGTGIEISYDIAKTDDDAFVITGNTFSTDINISSNHGGSDLWLIKIDTDGNLLWEKTLGGSNFDAGHGVSLTQEGGFVLAGNSKSSDMDADMNQGENDIWLIKTDRNGVILWQKTFGGSGLDFGYDAIENKSGELLLVGQLGSADFPNVPVQGPSDLVVILVK